MTARVLLVEAADLCEQLGNAGYEVTSVDACEAGLAQLEHTDFDVILCEVHVEHGVRFLRAARQVSTRSEVIVLAASADRDLALECLRAGAFDLLERPVATGELLLSVSRAAERRSLRTTSMLAAASQIIFATTDQEDLPRHIVDTARDVMGADDVSLMLVDGDGDLVLAHTNASSQVAAPRAKVAMGERISGRVALEGKPIIMTNDRAPVAGGERMVYSAIVYPLLAGGRILGVLNLNRVTSRRPFRDSDLASAGVLAAHCVLALENARLTREFITAERLAGVGELAAGIAHEINNPMVALLANLTDVRETLRELERFGPLVDALPDTTVLRRAWQDLGGTAGVADMQQALLEAEQGARRIREVTAEVRALSGHDDGYQQPFRARDAIRSALRVAGVHLRHRIKVDGDEANGDDTWLWGSSGAVAQAVVGLLVAGAEAIEDDRSGATIQVGACRDGDRVVISVQHPWHLHGLRVPGAWPEGPRGRHGQRARTVWMAREIGRRHGGELQVLDTEEGTLFRLALPHLTLGTATPGECESAA